jgi:hypothetical protein
LKRYLCVINKVDTLTINNANNIKFQNVSNIRINDSTLTKQENNEVEIRKKLDVIEGIKDSNVIRRLC